VSELSQDLERPIASSDLALLNERRIEEAFGAAENIGAALGEELDGISQKERESFLSKPQGDERERIVGNLMLVLEKHEAFRAVGQSTPD